VRRTAISNTTIGQADCNAGERATGGGYDQTGSRLPKFAHPVPTTPGATPTGFKVTFDANATANVYAICASP